MKIEFRKADAADAELLIEIYNASFYNDYLRYEYGKSGYRRTVKLNCRGSSGGRTGQAEKTAAEK